MAISQSSLRCNELFTSFRGRPGTTFFIKKLIFAMNVVLVYVMVLIQ